MSRPIPRAAVILVMMITLGLPMAAAACNGGEDEQSVFDSPTFTPLPTVPTVLPTMPYSTPTSAPAPATVTPSPEAPTPASTGRGTAGQETAISQETATEAAPYSTEPAAVSPVTSEYLTEEIAPCTPIEGSTVDPCDADWVWLSNVARGMRFGPNWAVESWTMRQYLDGRELTYIPHMLLRGTYIPGTMRCGEPVPFRPPSYVDPDEFIYLDGQIPIHCYADVRANDYIIGNGPSRLTLLITTVPHWEGEAEAVAKMLAESTGRPEEEFWNETGLVDKKKELEEINLIDGYDPLGSDPGRENEGIYGREVLLFIGPSYNHAIEVWQVTGMWDVQRQDDGTLIAVMRWGYVRLETTRATATRWS